jgi:hypothetical protein
MKLVITVSKTFPKGHPRQGEETGFPEKIMRAVRGEEREIKNHTCRANVAYWAKKIMRLKEVGGVLSVRYWSGTPYRSKQVTIVNIPAEYVGFSLVEWYLHDIYGGTRMQYIRCSEVEVKEGDGYRKHKKEMDLKELAENDGLSVDDFKAWFRDCDLSKELIMIHFTKFRY